MKQLIEVAKKPIQANLSIPGSKSITNRAVLLAALASGVSEIFDILISDDTKALIKALIELGVIIQLDEAERSCIVGGVSGHFPKQEAKIWCAEAGTVERFLLAACASSPGKFFFDGSLQLRTRPIEPLLRNLCNQGANVIPRDADKMPFVLQGIEGLHGGVVDIDGSDTSQYISALLMVAPFAKSTVTINVYDTVSSPFVEMTCAMMAEFGVLVRRFHQSKFSIPVPQRYIGRDYHVEPDLTTASYFFAAAAVTGGQVTIQPINIKYSMQGDARFLTILEKMGCKMIENQNGLTLEGRTELQGINVDMSDCSDTFMTLAAIAPFAKTPTTITNIAHTRLQESNRISVMRGELAKLKIKVEEGPDWIKIYPSTPSAGIINSHHDHRIAMAFSIIGLRVPGIEIEGAECVTKTCPDFFELWKSLY